MARRRDCDGCRQGLTGTRTVRYLQPYATHGGASCATNSTTTAFEPMSKRRKGFPSETRVKRGPRVVHGDKELREKLGRNDRCPCGSGRRFQSLLPGLRTV